MTAKRAPRAKYTTCPDCEANFVLTRTGQFPPHRGIKGQPCGGGTFGVPAAVPVPIFVQNGTPIIRWRQSGDPSAVYAFTRVPGSYGDEYRLTRTSADGTMALLDTMTHARYVFRIGRVIERTDVEIL